MSSEKAAKVVIKKRGNQFWRNLLNKWPFLVWLGVIVLAFQLHRAGDRFERMNGVVVGEYEHVSPLQTGTVEKLMVELNDQVAEGQVIAVMDSALLDQEIKALGEELGIDKMERNRRFQDNLNSANLQLLKARAESQAAQAEVRNAQAEIERVNALPEGSPEKLRPNLARLGGILAAAEAKASEFSEEYMKGLEENVRKAQELVDRIDKIDTDEAVSERLNLLMAQKERMTIRAKNSGYISSIRHYAGDIVQDGDPIAVIVTDKRRRVRGIVIDEYIDTVKVGDKVWITPEHKREDLREAEIIAVAPTMTAVPDTASASPNRMIFGREIVCALPENDKLLPNQRVIIHVSEPGKVDFWSLTVPHRDPNPRE